MENIIRVNKKDNPFAQIDKMAIQDERLSWKARGLLCYLLSKPNDWKVIVKDLINRSQKDGDASVRAGIKELRNFGYMRLNKVKNEAGRVDHCEYIVFEKPLSDFPQVEKPQVENRGNSNNELTNNELTNKLSEPTPRQEMEEFIEKDSAFFEEVVNKISEHYKIDVNFLRSELVKFKNYWTEKNKSGTKMKWEMQQTFELRRRIATWLSNSLKFNKAGKSDGLPKLIKI
jgi:hypothetical protein